MKRVVAASLTLVLLTASNAAAIPPEAADLAAAAPVKSLASGAPQPLPYIHIPVFEARTPAYDQYKKRPTTELSKLIYLGDLLKSSSLEIVHSGQTYIPRVIAPMITLYVRMNYKKEKAEDWIAKHAYRNGPSYGMIYVRDSEGKLTLLRDFLLEELKAL